MGRTAWTVAGTVVGAYFGYPQLGALAGSFIGGAIEGPTRVQGPTIGETGVQTSKEGAPRAICYGTVAVTGNVIATGPLLKIFVDVPSGDGKGSGGGTVTSQQQCYRTFAIRICEGPIGGILRVWEDEKLVYDVRPGSLMLAESAKWMFGTGFYYGDEAQLPDAFLAINVNPDIPAFRGTAYMVKVFVDLTDRRGSIPQYRFEVAASTQADLILNPLIVTDWTGSRPVQQFGDMQYWFLNDSIPQVYSDYGAATIARAAMDTGTAGEFSQTFVAYTTSSMGVPSVFTGGATTTDDPQYVFYRNAYRVPDFWDDINNNTNVACGPFLADGVVPDDNQLVGIYDPGTDTGMVIASLFSNGLRPTTGPLSWFYNNCVNYPIGDSGFPQASGTPALILRGERVPSPPTGFSRISGTAKQLCGVEYRSNVLYQNALGPVLLPDDPDYDNATFWSDARDAAILAGTMQAGVVSWPVVVSEYASGYQTLAGLPVELGIIVSDIHKRCKVPEDKYDVTELNDLVAGLVLAGDYTGADAIDALRSPYFFDKSEYDKKLNYPKRGAAVVDTLTFDDLVEEPDDSLRQQAIEYPKKLNLFYQHAISGYAVVKATSARSTPDARVIGELSVQVPVVLNENQAAQTASKLHKVAWADADGEVNIAVPESFIRYTPSDCIGLALNDNVDRLRIDSVDYEAGVLRWKLRHDRQSAYTSHLTGVPIPPPTLPPSTITGPTIFAFLDIPSRADFEDDLNYYVAGIGESPAWYGYRLQRSFDGGANYTTVIDVKNAPPVMGELVDYVADASDSYTDTTNTVNIRLFNDAQSIDSITDAQFLSEGGAFALEKADGSYELMQYLNAEEDSSGLVYLTTLHRGLLNSGTAEHLVGAKFVMLDRVTHLDASSSWIGQPLTHKAISFDQAPEEATVQTDTYVGRSQLEWPVAYLTLTRAGDVVTVTWTPRHRFGTDDAPVASINFQGYRVTFTGTSSLVFETGAQSITQDVSSIGGAVTVSVSALNRITGAGPATSESI